MLKKLFYRYNLDLDKFLVYPVSKYKIFYLDCASLCSGEKTLFDFPFPWSKWELTEEAKFCSPQNPKMGQVGIQKV